MKTSAPSNLPELKREYYRRNFVDFCAQVLKIRGIMPGEIIPLKLDSGQKRLYAKMVEQKREKGYIRIITLKGRQSGWSTLSEAMLFHAASLTPNYNTLLIAHDQPSTQKIFEIAHLFWESMPEDIRPMIRYSNKRELVFANPDRKKSLYDPGLRSRMDFEHSRNINAGTATTRQALHVSEVAKFDPSSVDLLLSSLLPTIHPVPGTIVIMESTAYVAGVHFRELCDDARRGRSPYAWCFSPWWLNDRNSIALREGEKIIPTREEQYLIKLAQRGQPEDDVPPHEITPEQIKWYRERVAEFGDLFPQEYPSTYEEAWVNRDLNVFDRQILMAMKNELRDPKRLVDISKDGQVLSKNVTHPKIHADSSYIAIWEEPKPGIVYDIGVDPAAGLEHGDWCVAEVFRRDTKEQVAEYRKKIDPVDLAREIYWLGKYYNTAQIVCEMNGVGYITGNELARISYPYIYIWRHRERTSLTLSSYAGWKTTAESKKLLVGTARHLFVHHKLKIRSRVLWDEMSQYVHKDEYTFVANIGHDDCVSAMLLALQGGADEMWGAAPDSKRSQLDTKDRNPNLLFQTDPRAGKGIQTSGTTRLTSSLRGVPIS